MVSSYEAGETGAYSLSVQATATTATAPARPAAVPRLPVVESQWGVDAVICQAAYAAMGGMAAMDVDLSPFGNVGTIDYAARERNLAARQGGRNSQVGDYRDNFVAMASWGRLGRTPQGVDNCHRPLSEYLTAVADCDRTFGFNPVTRFN